MMVDTYKNIHGSGIKYTIIPEKVLSIRSIPFIMEVLKHYDSMDEMESNYQDLLDGQQMMYSVFFESPEFAILFPYLIMEYEDMKKG